MSVDKEDIAERWHDRGRCWGMGGCSDDVPWWPLDVKDKDEEKEANDKVTEADEEDKEDRDKEREAMICV